MIPGLKSCMQARLVGAAMKPDGLDAVMWHDGKIIRVFLRSCSFTADDVHCWRAFDAKGEFVSNLRPRDEGVVWAHGRSTVVLEAISKLVGSVG